jgi:hypothetical protein
MGTAACLFPVRKAMSVPAILSDVVADVVAAADKLRADDRLITSPDAVLGDLEAILGAITTLQAAAVRRLRDAWNIDATTEVCGRSMKRWLVEEQLLPGPEASRLMRLMHTLPAHPLTESAFETAQINAAHAAAIVTALATLPPDIRDTVEPHLIERAEYYPPEEISGFVDELLDRLGMDKASDLRRERRHAQRQVSVGRTLDGGRSLVGTLTPEIGEQLEQALALATQGGGLEDKRTVAQRHHDALGVIAASYLANHQTPSFNGAPRTVIVTIDLQTLENQLRQRWLTLPSGAVICADTARRLACDAELIPAVLGSNSEVLDIGQADHEFTTAIRRAAYLQDDGRCAFPNCCNPVSELHHIAFRRHGGPTSLDNAAWLCAYHHWLAHEGRWTLARGPDRNYLWTGPHGQQRTRHLSTA